MLATELPYNRAISMIYLEDSFGMSAGNNVIAVDGLVECIDMTRIDA